MYNLSVGILYHIVASPEVRGAGSAAAAGPARDGGSEPDLPGRRATSGGHGRARPQQGTGGGVGDVQRERPGAGVVGQLKVVAAAGGLHLLRAVPDSLALDPRQLHVLPRGTGTHAS